MQADEVPLGARTARSSEGGWGPRGGSSGLGSFFVRRTYASTNVVVRNRLRIRTQSVAYGIDDREDRAVHVERSEHVSKRV